MSSKTMEEKIEFLDSLAKGTLFLTHYSQWELGSHGDNSLFSDRNGIIGSIRAPSLTECIDLALQTVGKVVALVTGESA